MSEEFLREVILPRLDSLENEVKFLRDFTWPVCQHYIEKHNLPGTLESKKKFLSHLYRDEALELLKRKSLLTASDQVLFDKELREICSAR